MSSTTSSALSAQALEGNRLLALLAPEHAAAYAACIPAHEF